MRKSILLILVAALFSSAALAQGIQAFAPGVAERASTRILYWDGAAQQAKAEVAINFGQPTWKADYQAQMDQLKGKYWRLGKDFWTTLDTNVPLEIAGVKVASGDYYLALYRSDGGDEWHLAVLDPDTVREHHMDAFEVTTRLPDSAVKHKIPLSLSESDTSVEELKIELTKSDSDMKDLSLAIAWGTFELSAPIKVTM